MMKGKSLQDIRRARKVADSAALDQAYREACLELPLAALRQAGHVTQSQMAVRLGKSQAAVSKFEGRGDFLCSTLYRYAKCLGADIEMRISINGRDFGLKANETDESLFFSLVEGGHSCAAVPSEGNVIRFKDAVRRRTRLTGAMPWMQPQPSVESNSMTAALFKMAANGDEKKSATA